MAKEYITSPVSSPNGGNNSRRMSIGALNCEKTVSPRYRLRASIGSCHDLCKYGRKDPLETEAATSPLSRRISIHHQNSVEILVSPKMKTTLAAKIGPISSKAKTHDSIKSSGSENLMKDEISAEKKKTNKMAAVKQKPSTPYFRGSPKALVSSRKIQKAKPEVKNMKDDVVQEKTLYVIEMETEKKPLESYEEEIHAVELYKSSLSTSSDEKEIYVCESDYAVTKVEPDSVTEYDQTTNVGEKEKEQASREDEKSDKNDCQLGNYDTTTNEPDSLNVGEEEEASTEDEKSHKNDCQLGNYDSTANEPDLVNIVLRHEDVDEKKEEEEEAATRKLIETQKGKVKALVGAFETLISLREKKKDSASPVGVHFSLVEQYICYHNGLIG